MNASQNFVEGSSTGREENQSVSRDGVLGVRKRVSEPSGEFSFMSAASTRRKRPRMSAMGAFSSYGEVGSIGYGADRLPRRRDIFEDELSIASMNSTMLFSGTPSRHHSRTLSTSSFTIPSCPPSPHISKTTGMPIGQDRFFEGIALMRSASMADLNAAPVIQYPETSAKHFLNYGRTSIDFSPPDASCAVKARILSCSTSNVVFFTRGNRVHSKNINTNFNTDISQLCKVSERVGNIRVLEGGGISQPDILAIGGSKGCVQIWDVKARKATVTISTTKEITALAWNGPVLSVGGIKGSIRHYDTRLPASKIKEKASVNRHRVQVTCLQWNDDGRFLASGDSSGNVHCWEPGQKVPLEVGEFTSRRKKIQHQGKISAIAWSPWLSKLLATGDDKGILRLWNVNAKDPSTNSLNPGKVDINATISSIHFSPQCKEILTTHGAKVAEPVQERYAPVKPQTENSITVHSYPTLRHVTTYHLPGEKTEAIGDSVLDGTGTKLVMSVPSTNKIEVCTAWSKRKEPKRQQSFTDRSYGSIR